MPEMVNLAPTSFTPEVRRPNHGPRARVRNIGWPATQEVEEIEYFGNPINRPNAVSDFPHITIQLSDRALAFTVVGVAVKLIGTSVSDQASLDETLSGGGTAIPVDKIYDRLRVRIGFSGSYMRLEKDLTSEDSNALQTEVNNDIIVG